VGGLSPHAAGETIGTILEGPLPESHPPAMPVSSPTEQAELLQRIGQVLESLERHERQRGRRDWRRRTTSRGKT
jgi:hypothetical protein